MARMDDFNEAVVWWLARLYDAFPRRIHVRLDKEFGNDEEKMSLYADTVIFLKHEGFVRFTAYSSNVYFEQVTLSAKGLEILNAAPKCLEAKVPLGQRIASAAAEGTKEVFRALVQQVLSGAMS